MKTMKRLSAVLFLLIALFAVSVPVMAADTADTVTAETESSDSVVGSKALAAGIGVGIAAGLAAIGMGIAIGKSNEGVSRQPEAVGEIRTLLLLGIVFIETAIIYALIIAILVIFVL